MGWFGKRFGALFSFDTNIFASYGVLENLSLSQRNKIMFSKKIIKTNTKVLFSY